VYHRLEGVRGAEHLYFDYWTLEERLCLILLDSISTVTSLLDRANGVVDVEWPGLWRCPRSTNGSEGVAVTSEEERIALGSTRMFRALRARREDFLHFCNHHEFRWIRNGSVKRKEASDLMDALANSFEVDEKLDPQHSFGKMETILDTSEDHSTIGVPHALSAGNFSDEPTYVNAPTAVIYPRRINRKRPLRRPPILWPQKLTRLSLGTMSRSRFTLLRSGVRHKEHEA